MLEPEQVIPPKLRDALRALDRWFLIGGQAVRCFKPYRPTRDVDIGVANAADFKKVIAALRRAGAKAIESAADSVHFDLDGIDVSVFVLPRVARFVEGRRLALTGLLGSKLHAILDRGTPRDFFDLYVMMQDQHVSRLDAVREPTASPPVRSGSIASHTSSRSSRHTSGPFRPPRALAA